MSDTIALRDRDHLMMWLRIGIGVVLGVLAGLVVPLPGDATHITHVLVGFVVAGLAFALPLLVMAMRLESAGTVAHVDGLGESRNLVDVVALLAALASLGGVANMFQRNGGSRVFEAMVSVATIAVAWLMIHTVYMVRYARHYVNAQPGCITFRGQHGRTAHVRLRLPVVLFRHDVPGVRQTLTTPEVRKIVFFHTLLSYVLGTGIVATTINLVAGLAN